MKKLLILLLFLNIFGCNNIGQNKQKTNYFNCPRVFFSSEDKIYIDTIDGGNSIDDVILKAELNNFVIMEQCYKQNEVAIIPLDILIVAQPMNHLENSDVSMPVYVILLDQNDKVLETQYFMVSNSIKKNYETTNFIETDITDNLSIVTKNLETTQIVIGFMLNDKKRSLLN